MQLAALGNVGNNSSAHAAVCISMLFILNETGFKRYFKIWFGIDFALKTEKYFLTEEIW